MAMDAILKKLESRIEEFAQTHKKANDRVAELEARVEELEGQLGGSDELDEKVRELEPQRRGARRSPGERPWRDRLGSGGMTPGSS